MEPIRYNAWQVDIFNESDLVDRLGCFLSGVSRGSQAQVSEYFREVGPQSVLNEARVDFRIEVLHVEQVHSGFGRLLGRRFDLIWCLVHQSSIRVAIRLALGQYRLALCLEDVQGLVDG